MTQQPQQRLQPEWEYQWQAFHDQEEFLFLDWISPRTLEDFRGKRVADCGCGPGHHMRIVAKVAQHVTGYDLNTVELAKERLSDLSNISVTQADIALVKPDPRYDVVYSIGVVDHTDNPDATVENLKAMCVDNGLVIVWVWSHEGNGFMRLVVEPLRKLFLANRSRKVIQGLAYFLTLLLYPIVYTLYLLPLPFLPYYDYFKNFRTLSYKRNALNVFDKLNAPYTEFISYERCQRWMADCTDVSITPYKGVSWRVSGRVKRG